MLIGVIVLSILANGWLIDLSVWRYPISSSQPYIVKMTPDDVVLLLLCIGQILAETAAGTIALFAVTALRKKQRPERRGIAGKRAVMLHGQSHGFSAPVGGANAGGYASIKTIWPNRGESG